MTALEIVEVVKRFGGCVEARGSDRVCIYAPAGLLTETLKADVVLHKSELLRLLAVGDALNCYSLEAFTDRGKLCDICRGIGQVMVLDGQLCCTFCVETHAEGIARRRIGT